MWKASERPRHPIRNAPTVKYDVKPKSVQYHFLYVIWNQSNMISATDTVAEKL